MPKDVYLQPRAPDPVLPEETILFIAHKYVPEVAVVRGVDESGGEARAYGLDDDFILKVQRPHRLRPRTSLKKEVAFLNELAKYPQNQINVPIVLGYGREGDIEYTLLTRMPGKAFRQITPAPTGKAREAALFGLGATLRRIHRVSQDSFKASGLFRGDKSFEDFTARLSELFQEVVTRLEASRTGWELSQPPGIIAEKALARLPQSEERVALHSNPGPEHLFLIPTDDNSNTAPTFSGLIDFGDAYISHPALDLRRWQLPGDRASILEGYQSEGPLSASFLTTWRIVNILTDLTVISSNPNPEVNVAVCRNLQTMLSEIR